MGWGLLLWGVVWAVEPEPVEEVVDLTWTAPEAEPTTPEVVETRTEVLATPEAVTLTSAGRKAKPLRVVPRAGLYEVQIRRTATLDVEGSEQGASAAPEAITTLAATVGEATVLTVKMADLLGANPLVLLSLDQELRASPDLRVVLPLDGRLVLPMEVQGLPVQATDSLRELVSDVGWSMGLVRVPFPEEAVGVGGTWTWSRSSVVEGVSVVEAWGAELQTRRGHWVQLAVVMVATAPEGVEVDGLTVEALSMGATGTIWLDLRTGLPEGAELAVEGALRVSWVGEDDAPMEAAGSLASQVVVVTRPARAGGPG